MPEGEQDLVLMAGGPDDPFARAIAGYLGQPLSDVLHTEFPDDGGPMSGETKVQIRENIRGRDVFILWSAGYTNFELIRVLQLIDAARLSGGARRITLVCGELPYGRQDKTHERRESLSSRLVATLFESVKLDEVIACDLHSGQLEGHLRIPLHHLRTRPIWADLICRRYREWVASAGLGPEGVDLVLGVPDGGRARAVRELSEEVALGLRDSNKPVTLRLAHHDKYRQWATAGQVASHGLIGHVEGKVVWFVDDLLASGSTMFAAARAAREGGAAHVIFSATHAHGFDRPAARGRPAASFADQLRGSDVGELIVTDTRPRFLDRVRADAALAAKTTVLSVTPLFGEAIKQLRGGQTIREMVRTLDERSDLYRVVHEATSKPVPRLERNPSEVVSKG